MNKLPDKPSELIRLAIKDLEKVEAEPDKYRVDMSIWYDKHDGQPCLVCHCQRCGATENLVQISDGEEYCQGCLNDTLPVVDDGSQTV